MDWQVAHTILQGENLELHPWGAIWWPRLEILMFADVHLGKAEHFRRNGIAMPQGVSDATVDKMLSLLWHYKPTRCLILGDLFHSDYHPIWEEMDATLHPFREMCSFELIMGNHDVMSHRQFEKIGFLLHKEPYAIGPFQLCHIPLELTEGYVLCGHIHPAVTLKGKGHQRMRLPCFYFGPSQGILPAFGEFTGMANLNVEKNATVFVLTEDSVLEV